MRIVLCAALTALALLGAFAAEARMLKVVGFLENAVILPGNLPIRAKMDTGANTTSINARDIERYTTNGEDWVRFTVDTGDHMMELRRPLEGIQRVRRTGITDVERPVVRLGLCIAGYYKHALVNLTDRSNMSFPLLIGRRFMGTGGLVIDSAQQFIGNPVCPGAPK